MGDILKEAIADAKAVRETALQNAKMALEEAFTPQLKSMLSAKLREEEDEESAEEMAYEDEEVPAEEDEEMSAEVPAEEDEEMGEVPAEEGSYMEDEDEGDDDDDDDDDEESEEVPAEETEEIPAEEDEDNLDLESIIRELEDELEDDEEEPEEMKMEQDDAYDENKSAKRNGLAEEDETEEDDDVEIDESLFTEEDEAYDEDAENIGKEENKSDVFNDKKVKTEQSDSSKIGDGDNKVDIADNKDEEDPEESTDVYSELKQYKEAVHFLKDKLHEVNILNAKLLFTNKLFKAYSLNNNQKLKVVETFDRAQTTREIKLVYSTLAEQFGDNGSIGKKHSIKESASSAVSSTKPSRKSRKVITEEAQVANRFKKLAGLVK